MYRIGSVKVIPYAAEDIHSAVVHQNKLGAGSFFITHDPKYMEHTYRSPQTDCDSSAGLAFTGHLQIEQVQQRNEALSALKGFVDQQGFDNALILWNAGLAILGPLAKKAFLRHYNVRTTCRAKLLANNVNNGDLIKLSNQCWNVSGTSFSASAKGNKRPIHGMACFASRSNLTRVSWTDGPSTEQISASSQSPLAPPALTVSRYQLAFNHHKKCSVMPNNRTSGRWSV